jgi:hypothetical protein
MASFSFDNRTQQYRWTSGKSKGRFVSRAKVAALTEKYIDQSKERLSRVTESLLDGSLSVRQWKAGVAQILKFAHVNSYALGLGGTMRYDNAKDKGIIGARIKSEYQYLRKFSQDILDGKLSEAQIRARSKQYLNSLYATYELGRNQGHRRNGYKWERDIRSANESCATCIEIERRGWVEIGKNPPIGIGRICMSNCRCHKIYDTSTDRPEQSSLLSNSFGWLA